jgi:hypothetical protein
MVAGAAGMAGTISLLTRPCSLVSSSMISNVRAICRGVSTTTVTAGTARRSWNNFSRGVGVRRESPTSH